MISSPLLVLKDVVERFDELQIDYFLVGSLASMYYGQPRFTNDIDLVVEIKPAQISKIVTAFPIENYYCPPIEILRDEVLRMGSFNLIHQESQIKVDIQLMKNSEFYESEMQRRRKIELTSGFKAYIASPEDVIIKKLDFYREGKSEKHLSDIRGILAETEIDSGYLNKWLLIFGLKNLWDKI